MASLLGAIAEASTAAVAADPLQVERMVSLLGVVPRWQLAAVYRFQTRRRRPAASRLSRTAQVCIGTTYPGHERHRRY
jgi:hypothetical protein